ncbi:helix-turn-helix transcriptional regulator [Treponema brennaborense]|uniref:Helix-turn-helix domain protein n=1 Tax=Treponema brennaborense (strain DSM 12168 / CIP 105900 / DD5/3) TaxID=906968 RepID=F4LN59_TREBD|nr:helix-turn-helix transcriptional regulator [Treponema brennaborense]AEE16824.1 helix-turn-helix domain protein [Treponema brennaborense DSM 12168]
MKLAEKIEILRKRNGWSQEELADKVAVSRQSVSKWESGGAVPELDKILLLSTLFGVSTDTLLKDDLSVSAEPASSAGEKVLRRVSLPEAERFIAVSAAAARTIAGGVAVCICSVAVLLLLQLLSETGVVPLSENGAAALGVTLLLAGVAAAVAVIILNGMKLHVFEYIKSEPFTLDSAAAALVQEKKQRFELPYAFKIVWGVVLCIVSVIPVVVSGFFDMSDAVLTGAVCLMLGLVAVGVFLFISAGMVKASYDQLLQTGAFVPELKAAAGRNANFESALSGMYWSVVTAAYLGYSFITHDWGRSWIIWPCAGVLYGIVSGIVRLRHPKEL